MALLRLYEAHNSSVSKLAGYRMGKWGLILCNGVTGVYHFLKLHNRRYYSKNWLVLKL